MIYINDYRSLNSLIGNKFPAPFDFRSVLTPFVGRTITVFVDIGGTSHSSFTGTLIDVLSDSIKLVSKLPLKPNLNIHNNGIRFNRSRYCKAQGSRLGTNTYILINHITALAYRSK